VRADGQLSSKNHVRDLLSNLCEDLGLTTNSAISHSTMFGEILSLFSLTLTNPQSLLDTRYLVDTMFDRCRDPRVARGLGCDEISALKLLPLHLCTLSMLRHP